MRRRALLPAIYCGLGVNRKKVFFERKKGVVFASIFACILGVEGLGVMTFWWNEEESCLAPIDGEREERKGRDGKV